VTETAADGPRLITGLASVRRGISAPSPERLASGDRSAGRDYRAVLADVTDAALVDTWAWAEARTGLSLTHGIALACVGSLARRDGGPEADLDLVLLHDGAMPDPDLAEVADRLWYAIWDAGLQLDHSVRTLADCRSVAHVDVPAAVGMIGLRHVAGDRNVTADAASAVLADWRGAARTRLNDLTSAIASRTSSRGFLAHVSEPDLKESRGGLRDARILHALAATWLADRPHGAADDAADLLADVRDALQRATRRSATRLSFREQDDVAAAMGLGRRRSGPVDHEHLRSAVPTEGRMPGRTEVGADSADELLAAVSAAGRTVRYALDTTIRQATRSAARPRRRVSMEALLAGRRPRHTAVADGIIAHDGELVLATGVRPETDPGLALRAARASVTTGLPLSPITTTTLAACPAPHAATGSWPPDALADLLAVLAGGDRLLDVLDALDIAGVMATWFPEWAPIRNRPQRTAVHTATVDRHSLAAVARLAHIHPTAELTEAGGVADPALLIGSLLHDVGKVPGEIDHAERGATIATGTAARLGLKPEATADVVGLVRDHLLLAETATGSDIADPAVVNWVARRVGTRRRLHLLAALTQADAQAAGPRAWTPWRAELVSRLGAAVDAALRDKMVADTVVADTAPTDAAPEVAAPTDAAGTD
jgi:[protein-PII] uridylyltransferase